MCADSAEQRNRAVREALAGCAALRWVLFVDTDQVVPPATLPRLLSHGAPLVAPVILQRVWPFDVAAFVSADPPVRVRLADVPPHGLLVVAACGAGVLLVRRAVLDALRPPWFRCGQRDPAHLQEDLDFTLRAAAAGFPPQLDGGCRVGHNATVTVWPGADGRPWLEPLGAAGERIPVPSRRFP
jgi:hypothetical protein